MPFEIVAARHHWLVNTDGTVSPEAEPSLYVGIVDLVAREGGDYNV